MSETMSNAILWYLHELSSRVVAESGIASDRHHVGKLILRSLKDDPDRISQIDGATDEKETFKSTLERSVRCASSFRNVGLKYQDVIISLAPNHLDLAIPIYASLYLGVMFAGLDKNLGVSELRHTLKFTAPKIIFCENSNVTIVEEALQLLNMSAHIVTFGEKQNHMTFTEFLDTYDGGITIDEFKPADFDPEETNIFLLATSGTTDLPKTAVLTHKNIYIGFPTSMYMCTHFPTPINIGLVISPIQWLSAVVQYVLAPILRYTRLQSSALMTEDHAYFLINKYKPEYTISSPTFMTTLLKPGARDKCDFTFFRYILVGGSAVSKDLIINLIKHAPKVRVMLGYGLSEIGGMFSEPKFSPFGSVGVPMGLFQFRFVNAETNNVINDPNVHGELRIKGPSVTKGYYNNPEKTAEAFDEEGWFKTGDIFYRDEYYNLYFVDRLKMLLKYRNHQVSPVEIEQVILKHPSVLDVAVTGIPDQEFGDLIVALVVPINGMNVTAQEIKDLVKESLTDTKQLRGGVIFVKELPTTSTTKVDRKKLKALAMSMKPE